MFANFTLTAMQITDAWLVGQLGSDELAAITPPSLVIMMLHAFGCGTLSMIAAFVSQARGQGDTSNCGILGWQGVYVAVVTGLLCLGLWPFCDSIFALLDNESARVFTLQSEYMRVMLLSLPPAFITVALSNFFLGVQSNRLVIASSGLALLLNLLASFSLAYGWFGLAPLGFVGVAVAP